MRDPFWRIQLLGGLALVQPGRVITRFRTQKTSSLLAYLAYYRRRSHTREDLAALFWPESEPEAARGNLRVAISSLLSQLEPPGVPRGAVVTGGRLSLRLSTDAVTTDVAEFDEALEQAEQHPPGRHRLGPLTRAVELYHGPLLPGAEDAWVVSARERTTHRFLCAISELTQLLAEAGEMERALRYSSAAVGADPMQEELHGILIQLLLDAGRPRDAIEQYVALEETFQAKLRVRPSFRIRRLLAPVLPQFPVVTQGARWQAGKEQAATLHNILPPYQAAGVRSPGSRTPAPGSPTVDAGRGSQEASFLYRAGPAAAGRGAARAGLPSSLPAEADEHGRDEYRHGGYEWEDPAPQDPAPQDPAPEGRVQEDRMREDRVREDRMRENRVREDRVRENRVRDDRVHEDAPPTRAASRVGPGKLTRFFGRTEELQRLKAALMEPTTRLVTLTGPGGSGKTRLAVECAAQLQAKPQPPFFASCFVGLSNVRDGGSLLDEIARAHEISPCSDRGVLEQVVDALSDGPRLLLLDNLEHLVENGAPIVLNLLKAIPDLTCLVTSQQTLDLSGEHEFPVSPLPIPPTGNPALTPEEALAYPSVQLFMDRAQHSRPDFQLNDRNVAVIAGLCERLEGIPLSLELAASWTGTLTPAQMLDRLSRRFDLLVSRKKDLPPRQRALRAAFDWSYGLLAPELRRFFGRLSIFRGGWSLEGAEAVCDEPRVLEYLDELRTRSLIETRVEDPDTRYRLLETLREYAAEQLDEEERQRLARRHAAEFARLAEEAEPELKKSHQEGWLRRLELEQDNFRAALEWSMQHDSTLALRLAGSLWRFWYVKGYFREGRARLQAALVADTTPAGAARARALNAAGVLEWAQGDYEMAERLYREGLEIRQALGDQQGAADCLSNLALLERSRGELAQARRHYESTLAIYRDLQSDTGIARTLSNLAIVGLDEERLEDAQAALEESLRLYQRLGDRWCTAAVLHNLGEVARQQRDYTRARELLAEGAAELWALGDPASTVQTLHSLAGMAVEECDFRRAALLFGAADAAREGLGMQLAAADSIARQDGLAATRLQLSEEAFLTAWSRGRSFTLEQAVQFAIAPGG